MRSRQILPLVLAIVVCGAAESARAEHHKLETKVELKQTGESAPVDSPACGNPDDVTAAAIVRRLGVEAVQSVNGSVPILTIAPNLLSPGNQRWLTDRLGLNNGKSSCATICLTYPQSVTATPHACMAETGYDNQMCSGEPAKLIDFTEVNGFTRQNAGANTVFCVNGKNWDSKRNRWFWVYLDWDD